MPFSVCFHHFHNQDHAQTQGSVGEDEFHSVLDWLRARYNILSAQEYLAKFVGRELACNDVCLSFDDGLKSQKAVAVPILEALGIKAFFFVQSGILSEDNDWLKFTGASEHQLSLN